MQEKLLLVFLGLCCLCASLELPSTFTKCKRNDPDFNNCMQKAIQGAIPLLADGIPSLGIEPAQPLHVAGFTVGEGTGVVHVKQVYKNVDVYNVVHAQISNVRVTIGDEISTFKFNGFIPELKLVADYELNGRILVLPVVGKGKCSLKLINTKIDYEGIAETYEKKGGKKYLRMKDLKISLSPDKVEYNFENLFDGDKRLGEEVNHVLNENNLQVFNDVKSGYEDTFAAIFKNVANSVFTKIPFQEVFPAA